MEDFSLENADLSIFICSSKIKKANRKLCSMRKIEETKIN